jgi:hypothetical protein
MRHIYEGTSLIVIALNSSLTYSALNRPIRHNPRLVLQRDASLLVISSTGPIGKGKAIPVTGREGP